MRNKNPTEDKFGNPDTGKREREPVLIKNSTDVFIYQKTSIASSRPYLDSTARASHLAPNQPNRSSLKSVKESLQVS